MRRWRSDEASFGKSQKNFSLWNETNNLNYLCGEEELRKYLGNIKMMKKNWTKSTWKHNESLNWGISEVCWEKTEASSVGVLLERWVGIWADSLRIGDRLKTGFKRMLRKWRMVVKTWRLRLMSSEVYGTCRAPNE